MLLQAEKFVVTNLQMGKSRAVIFNQGSARSYTNFRFILSIKLNAVFCIEQLNYCTGVPRVTEMFSWGSASTKRLKTIGLG